MILLIVTVTLNPAIDRTVTVESFSIDKVNRVKEVQRDAGGKGLNVSKTIKALGGESEALVLLGGRNGKWISEEAARLGIQLIAVPVEGETRENIKIVGLNEKTYTDLNESGPEADESLLEMLLAQFTDLIGAEDALVLSGSPLPGMPFTVFKSIIEAVSDMHIPVIVDVEGDYLKHAIEAKPTLIKPNIDELEAFLGVTLDSVDKIISAAKAIIDQGVSYVVVSRGEAGLLWVDSTQVLDAKGIAVEVKSTVGAGDAVVAALVMGLNAGLEPEAILRTAVATATSVIMNEGSKTGNMENLKALEAQVVIQKLEV